MPLGVTGALEICVGLVLTLVLARGGLAAGEGINIPAFKVLCGLGRQTEAIAQMDPNGVLSTLANWKAIESLIEKIEKFKSETNSSSGGVVEIRLGDNSVVKFHPGRCKAKANVFLSAITERLKNKEAEVIKRRAEAEEALKDAKNSAPGAFGEANAEGRFKEAGDKVAKGLASSHNRNGACKEPDGSNKAGKAGSSIPHDILCVCAQESAVTKACGVTLTQTWSGSTFTSGENDWALLAGQCGIPQGEKKVSVKRLEHALRNFEHELGRGVKESGASNPKHGLWTLGQIKSTGTCQAEAQGQCVNYAKTGNCDQASGGCVRGEIGWLNVLNRVLGKLREAEEAGTEANNTVKDAETLVLKAEGMLMDLNATAASGDCGPSPNEPGRGGTTRGSGVLVEGAASTSGKQTESLTVSAQKATQVVFAFTFLIYLLGAVSL